MYGAEDERDKQQGRASPLRILPVNMELIRCVTDTYYNSAHSVGVHQRLLRFARTYAQIVPGGHYDQHVIQLRCMSLEP
jgi:hypothetical protein